jgi:hypothetical protein
MLIAALAVNVDVVVPVGLPMVVVVVVVEAGGGAPVPVGEIPLDDVADDGTPDDDVTAGGDPPEVVIVGELPVGLRAMGKSVSQIQNTHGRTTLPGTAVNITGVQVNGGSDVNST